MSTRRSGHSRSQKKNRLLRLCSICKAVYKKLYNHWRTSHRDAISYDELSRISDNLMNRFRENRIVDFENDISLPFDRESGERVAVLRHFATVLEHVGCTLKNFQAEIRPVDQLEHERQENADDAIDKQEAALDEDDSRSKTTTERLRIAGLHERFADDEQSILQEFFEYRSTNYNNRPEQLKQSTHKVSCILKMLYRQSERPSSEPFSMEFLRDTKTVINGVETFIASYLSVNDQYNAILPYLKYFRHFLDFLVCRRCETDEAIGRVRRISLELRRLIDLHSKLAKKQRLETGVRSTVTYAECLHFLSTESVRLEIRRLQTLLRNEDANLSEEDYMFLLDLVVCILCFRNGARPEFAYKLTMAEYGKLKQETKTDSDRDRRFLLFFPQGKAFRETFLVMNEREHELLQLYVKVRNGRFGERLDDEEPLFLGWRGGRYRMANRRFIKLQVCNLHSHSSSLQDRFGVDAPVTTTEVRRASCTATFRFFVEFDMLVNLNRMQIGQALSGHTAKTRLKYYVDSLDVLCIDAYNRLRMIEKTKERPETVRVSEFRIYRRASHSFPMKGPPPAMGRRTVYDDNGNTVRVEPIGQRLETADDYSEADYSGKQFSSAFCAFIRRCLAIDHTKRWPVIEQFDRLIPSRFADGKEMETAFRRKLYHHVRSVHTRARVDAICERYSIENSNDKRLNWSKLQALTAKLQQTEHWYQFSVPNLRLHEAWRRRSMQNAEENSVGEAGGDINFEINDGDDEDYGEEQCDDEDEDSIDEQLEYEKENDWNVNVEQSYPVGTGQRSVSTSSVIDQLQKPTRRISASSDSRLVNVTVEKQHENFALPLAPAIPSASSKAPPVDHSNLNMIELQRPLNQRKVNMTVGPGLEVQDSEDERNMVTLKEAKHQLVDSVWDTVSEAASPKKRRRLQSATTTDYAESTLTPAEAEVLKKGVKLDTILPFFRQFDDADKMQYVKWLEVKTGLEGRVRGLFTRVPIPEGAKVIDYRGKIRSEKAHNQRLERLSEGERRKVFAYRMELVGKKSFVEADRELYQGYASLGRLINHSRTCANVRPQTFETADKKTVVFVFVATQDIPAGKELFFDYGDKYDDLLTGTSPAWFYYTCWCDKHDGLCSCKLCKHRQRHPPPEAVPVDERQPLQMDAVAVLESQLMATTAVVKTTTGTDLFRSFYMQTGGGRAQPMQVRHLTPLQTAIREAVAYSQPHLSKSIELELGAVGNSMRACQALLRVNRIAAFVIVVDTEQSRRLAAPLTKTKAVDDAQVGAGIIGLVQFQKHDKDKQWGFLVPNNGHYINLKLRDEDFSSLSKTG